MRITNSMMSNNILLNINQNMRNVNKLYLQMASTKKFLVPSDDPIAASRALKYRTILAENEQYQKNVAAGVAWTEISEDGIKNEVIEIMKLIREKAVKADAAENIEDKQIIAKEIEGLWTQLAQVMNKSYIGRYVYSGYRTDEPGVFIHDDPDLDVKNITHNYTSDSLEKIKYYHKYSDTEYDAGDAYILKLPYTDATNIRVNGSTQYVKEVSLSDPDCYKPGGKDMYYIKETGELVFGPDAVVDELPCEIQYDKKGFKENDLNPKVYFTCDIDNQHYNMDNQNIEYEFSVGVRFPVNVLAKDIVSGNLYGDLMSFTKDIANISFSNDKDLYTYFKNQYPTYTDDQINELIKDRQAEERDVAEKAIDERFNNLIEIMDEHLLAVSMVKTDLGTRMQRIDLLKTRLKDDYLTYSELQSENEDIELAETAMKLEMAQYAYMASMQVGMSMMIQSLLNYM